METIREALHKELRKAEKRVAVLRGKEAMLDREQPGFLDIKAPTVSVRSYGDYVSVTLRDLEHTLPALPANLLLFSQQDRVKKQEFGDGNDKYEFFTFSPTRGVSVDLDRRLRTMKKCRKAIVKSVVDICGEPGDDVEIVEWIE